MADSRARARRSTSPDARVRRVPGSLLACKRLTAVCGRVLRTVVDATGVRVKEIIKVKKSNKKAVFDFI